MSTGRKFRAIPGSDWLLSTEDCVSCPECAFTFDAMHTTQDGADYDCPACGENELAAREFALRAALATADQASSALLAERDEAEARAVRAEAALKEIAENGCRCDLNPTRMIHRDNEAWMTADTFWTRYLGSADASVRSRARAALAGQEGKP